MGDVIYRQSLVKTIFGNFTTIVVSIGVFLSHFCSFSSNRANQKPLKLAISDVIDSKKKFQWRFNANFLWAGLSCRDHCDAPFLV